MVGPVLCWQRQRSGPEHLDEPGWAGQLATAEGTAVRRQSQLRAREASACICCRIFGRFDFCRRGEGVLQIRASFPCTFWSAIRCAELGPHFGVFRDSSREASYLGALSSYSVVDLNVRRRLADIRSRRPLCPLCHLWLTSGQSRVNQSTWAPSRPGRT